MRKRLLAVILCASMMFPVSASAEVLGYEATLNTYTQEKKSPQQFQIDDGEGNTVNALAKTDTLYVTAKNTAIRSNPGESGTELRSVLLGTKLERVAVCDNGWSKVTFQKDGEDKIIEVLAKRENWIIDRYRLHGNIRDFFDEQRIGGNAQRDESDCRSHFYHWIIKHLNTTRYGTKRKSTTYRDSDVTAVSAEDYEGAF